VSRAPGWLMRHRFTVEAYAGASAVGPIYAPAAPARGFVAQESRTVTAPSGAQVLSMTTIYCPLATVAPADSRVTLADGTKTRVIRALRHDGGGLPTPDHLEIVCE
jgi:hypothetical protein